ncbi:MJ0042 family finger-like protein [plant metagenome]|uniref:MJ0042 family finger-like protein n=1 Tax=plant metagenome TaxID=1297885 RepID=A0A484S9G3_9ZZZZ
MSSSATPHAAAPQPTAQVLAWLRGILPQLESLHRAGHHHGALSAHVLAEDAQGQPLLAPPPAAEHDEDLHGARAPGYAALEQYAGGPAGNVGPWTDVYALSAELCRRVTGALPPDAVMRVIEDTHVPLASRDLPGYPVILLKTIDAGLVLSPEGRSSSLAGYTALLAAAGQVGTVPMAPAGLGTGAAVAPPIAAPPPVVAAPAVAPAPIPALEDEWMPAPVAPEPPPETSPDAQAIPPQAATPIVPRAEIPPAVPAAPQAAPSTAEPAPPPPSSRQDPAPQASPAAAAAVAAATRPVRQDEGRVPLGMVAAVLALIIAAGLLFWWQQGDTPDTATADASGNPTPSAPAATPEAPPPPATADAPSAPPPVALASPSEAPPAPPAMPSEAPSATPAPPSTPAGTLPGMDAPPSAAATPAAPATPPSNETGALPGLPGLSTAAPAAGTTDPQPSPSTADTNAATGTPPSGAADALPTLGSPLPGLTPTPTASNGAGAPTDGPTSSDTAGAPAAGTDAPPEEPVASVAVTVNVQPWGEIVVNGSRRGVSPPLRQIQLAPGTYSVTVRNGDLPPYNTRLTVQPGKPASITHKF